MLVGQLEKGFNLVTVTLTRAMKHTREKEKMVATVKVNDS